PVFLNLHHGGGVFFIESSLHIDRLQTASRGRPSLRSPKPRFAATSSDTARGKCAIVGGPPLSGSVTPPPHTTPLPLARAISCAKTVGERSCGGRAISRTHTQMPSHMLRAENSSRWYSQSVWRRASWKRGFPSRLSRYAHMSWLSSMPKPASSIRYGTRPDGLIL